MGDLPHCGICLTYYCHRALCDHQSPCPTYSKMGESEKKPLMGATNRKREEPSMSSSSTCCCGPSLDPGIIRNAGVPLDVERSLTDKFSLLSIILYAVFMILVLVFAVHKGQYLMLVNGMDWRGQVCGKGDLAEYTHQSWTNPLMKNIWAGAIRTKSCQSPGDLEVSDHTLRCICNTKFWPKKFELGPDRSQALIDECNKPEAKLLGYFTKNVNKESALRDQAESGVTGGVNQPCAYLYRTKWAMRKCVPWLSPTSLEKVVTQSNPKVSKESTNNTVSFLDTTTQMVSTFMTDAAQSVHVLWVCALISVLLSLIMLTLLTNCTRLVVHGISVALFIMFLGATVAAWFEYSRYRDRVDMVPQLTTHREDQMSKYIFLASFISGCCLTVVHLCLCIFMCEQVEAARSIIEHASKSFSDTSQLLLYPIVHVLLFVVLLLSWLIGAILLYSAGDIEVASDGVASLLHTQWMRSSAVAYLIGLVWFTSFLNAMGYMIVAGTVFMTAFVLPKSKRPVEHAPAIPSQPMTVATCIAIRWHMGTAAFGSLVLSLLWIARIMINFFAKLADWDEGSCMRYLCCCCRCCTVVFQSFVRYMNKMAYLQTVLHGYDFCDAAFIGLQCVLKGIKQIGTTTYISSFVLVVVKVTISLSVTAIADLLIKSGKLGVEEKDLTYTWVPYAAVFASAFAISTAFMVILEVAIDAVLVGWCEAMVEVQDEHGEIQVGGFTADHIPQGLKEHMDDARWNNDINEVSSQVLTSGATKD